LTLSEFIEQAKTPFIIGKELYEGELRKKIGPTTSTSTMQFTAAAVEEELQNRKTAMAMDDYDSSKCSPAITHAVYTLRKRRFTSDEEKNTFKIGRAQDNDLIIADFVISKHHAEITLFHGMFFIVDKNSTNGTKVNSRKVAPQMKVQLQLNSTISFGRYAFIFAHPLQLYRSVRKEITED
jgi:hypothetical protein